MLSNSVSNLKLISVPLNGKSVDLSQVISVIDETVILLKAEQGEDDDKKACCTESFDQTEDKTLTRHISCHRNAIADYKDQLSNTAIPSMPHERIKERIVEETIDVFVPQVMKEPVKLRTAQWSKSLRHRSHEFRRKLGR